MLGGVVRRNYRSLVGVLAEDALRQLSADVAFLGASGIREDLSVMDTTMVEVPIKRGMIAASRRTVLLADAAKFEMHGSVRVCGAGELDVVVTDASAGQPGVAALERDGRRGGARVKIAILGGGGFRVPLVYGALLARAERLGLERGLALRRRRVAARADRAGARGARAGARQRGSVRARRRASTTRSTAPTSSSARSASASSRAASSTSACRSTRASSARRRPGPGGLCFALRTVPGDGRARAARRRARAATPGS